MRQQWSICYDMLHSLVIEAVSWFDVFKVTRLKIGVSMTKEGLENPCIHDTQRQIEREYS